MGLTEIFFQMHMMVNLHFEFRSKNVSTYNALNTIHSQDSDGLTAEAIEIEIVLCSGCSNHGSCDYNNTRNKTMMVNLHFYF
jgi:hypothetical protein